MESIFATHLGQDATSANVDNVYLEGNCYHCETRKAADKMTRTPLVVNPG